MGSLGPLWSGPSTSGHDPLASARIARVGGVVSALDWAVIGLYLAVTLAWGARHARRAGASPEQFFAAGRSLPWWLAGTSLVATTFAADTPLAVAGLVATEGIAGNWFWWADVLPAMLAAFLVAHLWRRSGVLTDNELLELRYGGRPAAALRLFRAFYFGVLRNAIVIGWVNLAMLKVLQLSFALDPASSGWILAALFVLTAGYTLLSGLWGVVLTDAFQFVIALGGSIALAGFALDSQGGLPQLLATLTARLPAGEAERTLALIPSGGEAFWAFVIYVAVKSWSSGNTEGNGYTAQRLLATRSERDARLAAVWFAIAHFVLRPWPWILVGLVALVAYPGLEDPEAGYVRALLDTLPNGVRGVLLAAMLAAFMSTVDTQLNWGASYLTNDVYLRFLRPGASQRSLVRVARLSVVALAAIGALATLAMPSIAGAWKFLASISAGTGLIALLRWFWWRINAWSEIAVMSASLLLANALIVFSDLPFPFSLAVVVALAVPFALAVTFATAPEDPEQLAAFYTRVRPGGRWGPIARRTGLPERRVGLRAWAATGLATAGVYALLLGLGGLLLGRPLVGALGCVVGSAALAWAIRDARGTRDRARS
jgi:Na+/proline symporter